MTASATSFRRLFSSSIRHDRSKRLRSNSENSSDATATELAPGRAVVYLAGALPSLAAVPAPSI